MNRTITKHKWAVYMGLAIILLIGTWLRISGILTNSFAFTYDVGRDMLALQHILTTHKLPLIGQTTGQPGLFYGPWWYYILLIPFIVSSGNPQGLAYFIAGTGIVSIVLIFLLGKKLSGGFIGLFFAGIISFSPPLIAATNQIWNPNLTIIITVLVLLVLYQLRSTRVKINKKIFMYLALGSLLGLLIDLEIVYGIIFTLAVLIFFVFPEISLSKMRNYFFIFLGIGIIVSPRIIFELRHSFIMTKTFLANVHSAKGGIGFDINVGRKVETLLNVWKDTVAGGNKNLGLLLFGVCIFIFIRFYSSANDKEKFFIKFCSIVILTFVFGLLFFGATWSHYTVALPVICALILGLGFAIASQVGRLKIITVLLSIIVLLIILNPAVYLSELGKPLWEGNASVYRNQLAAIDYVYKKAGGKAFNYIVYTPPVHDYTYKYLFGWYGKRRYGYIPSQRKETLFFLIMEPDDDYPDRPKWWLAVRKNDGRRIDGFIGKGRIAVETRIR